MECVRCIHRGRAWGTGTYLFTLCFLLFVKPGDYCFVWWKIVKKVIRQFIVNTPELCFQQSAGAFFIASLSDPLNNQRKYHLLQSMLAHFFSGSFPLPESLQRSASFSPYFFQLSSYDQLLDRGKTCPLFDLYIMYRMKTALSCNGFVWHLLLMDPVQMCLQQTVYKLPYSANNRMLLHVRPRHSDWLLRTHQYDHGSFEIQPAYHPCLK